MVDGIYLVFEGKRKKKTSKARWSGVNASIPMSDIRRVSLIDNSETCRCKDCGAYNREEGYCEEDYCYYSYDDEKHEEDSFIEVEDNDYVYKLCEAPIFEDKNQREFLNNILALIRKGNQTVDIPMIKREIAQKEEEEWKAYNRKQRREKYERRLNQKEKCGKCYCLQETGSCLLGYKVVDGIPQEPCVKPAQKRDIEDVVGLVEEFEERKTNSRGRRYNEYKRRLTQKITCRKCYGRKDNNTCLLGYKIVDGIPQEPCVRPALKRDIPEAKSLIDEFRGSE